MLLLKTRNHIIKSIKLKNHTCFTNSISTPTIVKKNCLFLYNSFSSSSNNISYINNNNNNNSSSNNNNNNKSKINNIQETKSRMIGSPGIQAMYQPTKRDYEDSLNALYSLQSNVSTIQSWSQTRKVNKIDTTHLLMDEMTELCQLVNINLDDRTVIHVAGTKGKGSTCSMVESIIRNSGFTTGMFTSPHLISPRERIKINGEMVSKELFAKHVFACWDIFSAQQGMIFPPFFKYITLVAMRIFQELKLDCKILEVGIGGRADSTNVFPRPAVTGITALGFDHMNVLGDTLPEIAYEKAGIMKPECPAFTVEQRADAMEVVASYAQQIKSSPLVVTPNYESYLLNAKIALEGEHQKQNSSIAIALCIVWLMNSPTVSDSQRQSLFSENQQQWRQYDAKLNNYRPELFLPLPESFARGLATVRWPGRAQHFVSLDLPNVDFFLDGAHTPESAEICSHWWSQKTTSTTNNSTVEDNNNGSNNNNNNNTGYILVYNSTGGRDPNLFLEPFSKSIRLDGTPSFNYAFVPIISADGKQFNTQDWEQTVTNCIAKQCQVDPTNISITNDTSCAIEHIQQISQAQPNKRFKVLITGSLYIVGSSLKYLTKSSD
ncbi:tetrahydrofolylpolyglutamate synthase [Heterostelium album PN500]|uniref:tetrahydrofolate synthase n=1 Tax=Heterostelium pallidum (strain ATCC 26659 / Pp 5 / PN500) TaxID=670386 RepID=D3B885_HETP5|nr:tetrahydrofolylpolyglutamate synthase [Heterostelium album PN500]EFA82253.1 tetrahydrofolylpolyglutamate synthase [Heterostelium album PN500]|eukprot:XP_020434370.1 tetrahydrofolylpolyglutamate synthase [Heterostelium album PN500]